MLIMMMMRMMLQAALLTGFTRNGANIPPTLAATLALA